jgi:hypothetical protein
MHGGAPGSGAPLGNQNALKYGRYTKEAREWNKAFAQKLRNLRALIKKENL